MSIQEKKELAKKLLEQAHKLNNEINREVQLCHHEWTPVISEPEKYQGAEFDHYEPHGSDPEPIYRYFDAWKPRWSRTCKKCSHKEYTYEMRPTKTEPYFG